MNNVVVTARKTIALLKYEELYIIVDSFDEIVLDAEAIERAEYYFNERTCPINYLGVKLVAIDGELDPHGVFEFIRVAFAPENDEAYSNNITEILTIFPELNPGLAEKIANEK